MKLKPPSLRWHHGWNVIAMALLFQSLCIGMSFYCFPLWVVPLSNEFSVTRSQIMLAIASSQVMSGLVSPFAGRAHDRLPPHWVYSGGAITFASGLLLIASAHAIWQIMVAFLILLPIGLVLTGVMAAQTLATRWFTKDRGFAIACATLGASLGGFTMPPIAAALMSSIGWRATIAIFAAAIVPLVAVSWRVLKKEPPQDAQESVDRLPQQNDSMSPSSAAWRTTDLLRNTNFRTIILLFLPFALTFNAVQMNLAAYTVDLGLTQQDAAFLVAQLAMFTLIGRIFFGKLIDRYDQRILYRALAGSLIIALIFVISARGFSGNISHDLLRIGIALLGLAAAGYVPLSAIVVSTKFGTRAFGQVTGLANTFLGFGSTGSFIAASLRDASGSYAFSFVIFLLLLAPGLWQIRKLK